MNLWLQITSGRGPVECCQAVVGVMRHLQKEATERGLVVYPLDAVSGPQNGTLRSVLLAIEGAGALEFCQSWTGSVQWIGRSPFRPEHKRKNWFVGITCLSFAPSLVWSEDEFSVETFRASGPGGQHVNKTESAVRVVHLPSGTTAIAQEERSQHLNRKLAIARLVLKLEEIKRHQEEKTREKHWKHHNELERGNPIMVIKGDLL